MQIVSVPRMLLAAALFVGCAGKTPPPDNQATANADKPAEKNAEKQGEASPTKSDADPAAEGDGEGAQAQGPDFKTLKTAALACVNDEGELDFSCEGYSNWRSDQPAVEGGKANKELFAMLASSNIKERALAADMLRATIDSETLDAATADKVLDAADKERAEALIKPMTMLAGSLALGKVGKLDRAIALAKKHPAQDFQSEMLFNIGDDNKDAKLVAWGVEAAKNPELENSALQLLTKQTSVDAAAACNAIDALRASKSDFVKYRAIEALAAKDCSALHDKLLDALEKVDVKKDIDQRVGYALDNLCRQKDMPAKRKERATKLARRITESKAVHVNTRYYTLSAVAQCEPEKGLEFVAKFKNDPDKILAERATTLLKK